MKRLVLYFLILVAVTVYAVDPMINYGFPDAVPVTKSDTIVYRPPLRAVFFSATAGQTITVGPVSSGLPVLFTYGAAGTYILPVQVSKVYSTGTTVTGIVGLRDQLGAVPQPSPTATATATATATFTPTPTPTPP